MQVDRLPKMPDRDAGAEAARDWLRTLDRMAKDGDESAAAAIRASRTERPDLWTNAASIADQAEAGWLYAFAPDATEDALLRTALKADMERLRESLLAGSDDPVEQLLVSRIIVCHLAASHTDAMRAQSIRDGDSAKMQKWHADQAEQANRALLKAIEALARVRRLRGTAVQVNVAFTGGQQVNVGTVERIGGAVAALPDGAPALDVLPVKVACKQVER